MGLIDTRADQTTCTVAIVGAGSMAREHIRAFADVPWVTLAGIHSRTRSRAEELAASNGIPAVCNSVAELHEATQAELVVVAVPETATSPVSRACFEFPWTVLLEKPPGLHLSEAEDIHAAAAARSRNVLVALNRRFLSSTRAASADLSQCDGRRFIKVQDQQDIVQAAELGHPQTVVDNWMYANSIHLIDYFHLFGRGAVTAVRPGVAWDPERPGVVVSTVEFDSGDVGLYEGIWDGLGPWAVSVSTAERRWEMRPLEEATYQECGERQLHPVEVHQWDRDFKPGFRLQAEMAAAAALGEPSDIPSLDEAMKTMRLIAAIYSQEV